MTGRFKYSFLLLLIAVTIFSACNPTKKLKEGEYLVDKNIIKGSTKGLDGEELYSILKQKPNRKILGLFRFHLAAYNLPNNEKIEAKIKKKKEKTDRKNTKRIAKGKLPKERNLVFGEWLMTVVGEPPVILDSALIYKSTKQLGLYLERKGFFDGNVQDSVVVNAEKKKAEVYYLLEPKTPYTIKDTLHVITDPRLYYVIGRSYKDALLKPGENFDIDVLDAERDRITRWLRDRGYIFFNKNYIRYDADSALSSHQVNVTMEVKNMSKVPKENPDTLLEEFHIPYKIHHVEFHTNFDAKTKEDAITDTLHFNDHTFYYTDKLQYSPRLLIQSIFLRKGKFYKLKYVERSYRRLSALGIFQSINIDFQISKEDPEMLDCIIYLTPTKEKFFMAESKGTNTGSNLGVSANLTYSNKNTFGGAELLTLTIAGGFEAQNLLTEDQSAESSETILEDINILKSLNTIEFGPSLSVRIPKLFLSPFKMESISRSAMPMSTISTGLNFQQRPDYTRRISNISLGYEWIETKTKVHRFSPIDFSLIKINKSQSFEDQLNEINDQFLINSYQDHLTIASKYSFTSNSQTLMKIKHRKFFVYYRGGVELAGNLLRFAHKTFNAPLAESGSYEVFNVPFAQFIKLDNDVRIYRPFPNGSQLVGRAATGIGIALKNLTVLPFEKSYFTGGANGLRAWKARSIGPGSYLDPKNTFDKIGDLMLETNLEYRFDLVDPIKGAFFMDAGNIWLLNSDSLRPGGEFDFNRFYNEIAIGAGVGLRLDLTFFIIRFDFALQVKDPSLAKGERWVWEPKTEYNNTIDTYNSEFTPDPLIGPYKPRFNFNLGIGYPF